MDAAETLEWYVVESQSARQSALEGYVALEKLRYVALEQGAHFGWYGM